MKPENMLSALRDVRNAYQQMFDVMPVAWQTIDNIVNEAIRESQCESCEELALVVCRDCNAPLCSADTWITAPATAATGDDSDDPEFRCVNCHELTGQSTEGEETFDEQFDLQTEYFVE